MSNARMEWISKRAYALWEQEGRPQGRDQHHWDQAVRERDELERVALPEYLEKSGTPVKKAAPAKEKASAPAKPRAKRVSDSP